MSTPQPGASRRRRIAGERRGRPLPGDDQSPAPAPARPADEPVVPNKARRPSSGGAAVPTGSTVVDEPLTDEPTDEHADGTEPEPEGGAAGERTGWWGSRRSLIMLSAVLALLLALTGLAALGLLGTDGVQDINEAEAVDRSVRTAPAAAEAAAAAILAYDHQTLDADQDAAARYMTKEFAAEYAETFEKVVRPAAEQNRAKVTASVLASSVVRATEDTARVLVFVDQATTSTANERPQIALNRVEMSMVREGDSWLVADISSY